MKIEKIFFAWVSAEETFDTEVHCREDEDVFSFRLSEKEGEFAVATIEVRNPRRGLLSPTSHQRCFISAEMSDGSFRLLFSGRVVGVPVSMLGEAVELEFVGRPDDWRDRQSALVAQLVTSDRHHDALVSDATDLSQVLEGFAGLPRWDRVTGNVQIASIDVESSAGAVDLTDVALDDSLQLSISDTPISSVDVTLELSWTQTVPVFAKLLSADEGYGSSGRLAALFGGDGRPRTLTGEDFASTWPQAGSSLDGGWTVLGSYLQQETSGFYTRHVDVIEAAPRAAWSDPTYPIETPVFAFYGGLTLSGTYEQPRREVVTLTVSSDVQPIVEEQEPESLDFQIDGQSVVQVTTPGLSVSTSYRVPDGSGGLDEHFVSSRVGRVQLAWPILASIVPGNLLDAIVARAEARLRKSARCVTVSCEVPFETALDLSTSSVVTLSDDRVPGGSVTGKVTSVDLLIDGEGQCHGAVTFGVSIGRASSVSTPTHAIVPYSAPSEPSVVTHCRSTGHADDGTRALSSAVLKNSFADQQDALSDLDLTATANRFAALGYRWASAMDDTTAKAAVEAALAEVPTELRLELVSLEAVDETVKDVSVTLSGPVNIFRGINLET